MQLLTKRGIFPTLFVCLCAAGALGFATFSPEESSEVSYGPGSTDGGAGTFHKTTLAGSTGIVDESDVDEVVLAGGRAKIPNSVHSATARIRYNINFTPKDGDYSVDEIWIGLRYKDNGPKAQVTAKLKQYAWDTGAITTLWAWDSNDQPQDSAFQFIWTNDAGAGLATIEDYDAYYLEVTLRKISSTGRPEVAIVQAWVRQE